MPTFNFCSPPSVEKIFGKLSQRNQELIRTKLNQFQENPQHFSTFLRGSLRGKRKIKVRGDLRIILAICGECRELGQTKVNKCIDCDSHSDDDVILFNIGTHKEVY